MWYYLQEAESCTFGSPEFIDDHKLLVGSGSIWADDPSLLLVDTEKIAEGWPTITTFQLPYDCPKAWNGTVGRPSSTLERGAHRSTPTESSAAFYQDPAQRIIALKEPYPTYLVFRVEVLLELAEKKEGETVWWRDWRDRVFVPSVEEGLFVGIRVSGCRSTISAYRASEVFGRMVGDRS